MLSPIEVGKKSLENYITSTGDRKIQELKELGKKLSGIKVLNLTSSNYGGGVAETLFTLVPLMRDLGLEVDCLAIQGNDIYNTMSDFINKSLKSEKMELNSDLYNEYMEFCKSQIAGIQNKYDYIIIHTSDPIGMATFRSNLSAKWIWRCDLNIKSPEPEAWKTICPVIQEFDGCIFTMKQFIRPDMNIKNFAISPPSIDPLSLKNSVLSTEECKKIVKNLDVNPEKPIILQMANFDPSRDPLGLIDSYRIVGDLISDVQLVLITFIRSNDKDAWKYYEKTVRHAGEDYNIHFLSNMNGVGSLEGNALQRTASVIVQKTQKEEFGLVITEGLWKEKPVVASKVDGLSLQVVEGINGYLANTTEDFAEKILLLLQKPELAKQMGLRGKEYIRENFLITRQLKDYLLLLGRMSGVVE
jgi:trehalose synthase